MKLENNTDKKVRQSVNAINKTACSLKQLGEIMNNTVKVFRESKTVFDELKKVKLIK